MFEKFNTWLGETLKKILNKLILKGENKLHELEVAEKNRKDKKERSEIIGEEHNHSTPMELYNMNSFDAMEIKGYVDFHANDPKFYFYTIPSEYAHLPVYCEKINIEGDDNFLKPVIETAVNDKNFDKSKECLLKMLNQRMYMNFAPYDKTHIKYRRFIKDGVYYDVFRLYVPIINNKQPKLGDEKREVNNMIEFIHKFSDNLSN